MSLFVVIASSQPFLLSTVAVTLFSENVFLSVLTCKKDMLVTLPHTPLSISAALRFNTCCLLVLSNWLFHMSFAFFAPPNRFAKSSWSSLLSPAHTGISASPSGSTLRSGLFRTYTYLFHLCGFVKNRVCFFASS